MRHCVERSGQNVLASNRTQQGQPLPSLSSLIIDSMEKLLGQACRTHGMQGQAWLISTREGQARDYDSSRIVESEFAGRRSSWDQHGQK